MRTISFKTLWLFWLGDVLYSYVESNRKRPRRFPALQATTTAQRYRRRVLFGYFRIYFLAGGNANDLSGKLVGVGGAVSVAVGILLYGFLDFIVDLFRLYQS